MRHKVWSEANPGILDLHFEGRDLEILKTQLASHEFDVSKLDQIEKDRVYGTSVQRALGVPSVSSDPDFIRFFRAMKAAAQEVRTWIGGAPTGW